MPKTITITSFSPNAFRFVKDADGNWQVNVEGQELAADGSTPNGNVTEYVTLTPALQNSINNFAGNLKTRVEAQRGIAGVLATPKKAKAKSAKGAQPSAKLPKISHTRE